MTQPEALRLADLLERDAANCQQRVDAAAELRRLHQFAEDQIGRATAAEAALQMTKATHAENEALREANEAFGKRQEWWNEKMFTIEQQRDALLEAMKEIVAAADGKGGEQLDPSFKKARAAIAKAEGEKS